MYDKEAKCEQYCKDNGAVGGKCYDNNCTCRYFWWIDDEMNWGSAEVKVTVL